MSNYLAVRQSEGAMEDARQSSKTVDEDTGLGSFAIGARHGETVIGVHTSSLSFIESRVETTGNEVLDSRLDGLHGEKPGVIEMPGCTDSVRTLRTGRDEEEISMKSRLVGALASTLTAASLMLAACSTPTTPAPEGSGGTSPEGGGQSAVTVGFIPYHLDTYFAAMERGLKAELANTGGQLIEAVSQDDQGKEAQAFQDLIGRGVDVIVASALDKEGSVAGFQAAHEAGIPVICVNECINDADAKEYAAALVASDNFGLGESSGKRAATFIKENLNNEAHLGILNCDQLGACALRKTGFLKALDDAGVKYEIASDQQEYVVDKAAAVAESMLVANPQINVIFAGTEGSTTGSATAVNAAGLAGKVAVFGVDMSVALGESIMDANPIVIATTGQDGEAQGAEAGKLVAKVMANEPIDPWNILVPGILFSKDDTAAIQAWIEKNK